MSQQSALPAVVMSVLLHALVVAGLLWLKQPPPPTPIAIETSLVSHTDLENIKQSLNSANTQAPTKTTQSTSDTAQFDNEELAKRQAQFEAQMAEFAAKIDQEAHEERKAFEQALAEEARNAQAELEKARKNFENHDQTIKQNQESQAQARLEQEQYRNQMQQKYAQSGVSGSLGAGTPNTTPSSHSPITASKGKDKNALIEQLQALIYQNWQVPNNASGEKLQAVIKTDAAGVVQSIVITGGSPALKASLEKAIMASSPLTPLVGSEFRELRVNFVAR